MCTRTSVDKSTPMASARYQDVFFLQDLLSFQVNPAPNSWSNYVRYEFVSFSLRLEFDPM
jgi:hypothetical protein